MNDDANQVEFAERLADVLNASDDYGIDAIDLLDALASTGLKLVDDSDGDATIAITRSFRRTGRSLSSGDVPALEIHCTTDPSRRRLTSPSMGPDGLSATTTGGSGDAAEVVEEFASGRSTRRQAIGRLAILGIGLTSASTLLAACSTNSEPKSTKSEPKSDKTEPNATNSGPNILIVIADDMRLDWLRFMPKVRKLIQAPGRTFTQARCNVGLCQPSRVGLHTGQMSKNNNELGVGFHGTEFKDLNNSLGEWMRASGYHCGMFGKFINFWDGFGGVNAPAGWDTWVEFAGGGAANPYDFKVHLNSGTQRIKGTYDADYLASRASEFVRNSDLPFFCILAPLQPHEPFTPRADLADLYRAPHLAVRRRGGRVRQAQLDTGVATADPIRSRNRHQQSRAWRAARARCCR